MSGATRPGAGPHGSAHGSIPHHERQEALTADATSLPAEVREVADELIAALGDNLTALLWQGSYARGEATPESDHDMVVVLRRVDDAILDRMRDVFAKRTGWSTFVKSEQELRQYPATGRLQFHYGCVPLYGAIDAPPFTRENIFEDIRRFVVDLNHESRYRLLHGRKHYDSHGDAAFGRVRNARILYYFAKTAVLAMKARQLLIEGAYPLTRAGLRSRLSDPVELQIVDTVDRWAELKPQYEADFAPLARMLDAFARKLGSELETRDTGQGTRRVSPGVSRVSKGKGGRGP